MILQHLPYLHSGSGELTVDQHDSAREELVRALLDASRRYSTHALMFHQAVAHSLGLHLTDHKCLDIILGMGKATAGQLAEMTGLTTGAITSVINRLEKAGYVRRTKDTKDLRIVIVEPLYENLHPIREVFAPIADAMTELYSRYSAEELALLHDYLERCIRIMDRQANVLKETTGK